MDNTLWDFDIDEEYGVLRRYIGPGGDVIIPKSWHIELIGTRAFSECHNLTSITIPDGVCYIGGNAFNKCENLKSVTLPDSATVICKYAFMDCSALTSITIPYGTTTIDTHTFSGCHSLENVTIPDSVTSIEVGAFMGCWALKSITIPDGVTSIGRAAFQWCHSLANVTIPDSVTSVGGSAFDGCRSLKSITIPDGVTSILLYTFSGCHALTDVTLLGNVTSIAKGSCDAFMDCPALTAIISPATAFSVYATPQLKIAAAIGFAENHERYLPSVAEAYKKYAIGQKKRILPVIFEKDRVAALAFFADNKKITKANFEEEYFLPATAADAKECIAFLQEWKARNY